MRALRPRPDRLPARPAEAGLTIVELMIVVVIMGVLAAIAIPSYTAYVRRGRAAEATSNLQSIAAAQQRYRAEFGRYCDVSTTLTNFWPSSSPTAGAADWSTGIASTNWPQLGVSFPGRVRFRYSTIAGTPASPPPGEADYTSGPNQDLWYLAQAYGDLDGDGIRSTFRVYSNNLQVRPLTSDVE